MEKNTKQPQINVRITYAMMDDGTIVCSFDGKDSSSLPELTARLHFRCISGQMHELLMKAMEIWAANNKSINFIDDFMIAYSRVINENIDIPDIDPENVLKS